MSRWYLFRLSSRIWQFVTSFNWGYSTPGGVGIYTGGVGVRPASSAEELSPGRCQVRLVRSSKVVPLIAKGWTEGSPTPNFAVFQTYYPCSLTGSMGRMLAHPDRGRLARVLKLGPWAPVGECSEAAGIWYAS